MSLFSDIEQEKIATRSPMQKEQHLEKLGLLLTNTAQVIHTKKLSSILPSWIWTKQPKEMVY